jgi:ADP-ribose pyrophosphatase YjhB (NUDIX family)
MGLAVAVVTVADELLGVSANGGTTYEFPAAPITEGDNPADVAARALKEMTGLDAEVVQYFCEWRDEHAEEVNYLFKIPLVSGTISPPIGLTVSILPVFGGANLQNFNKFSSGWIRAVRDYS